MKELTIEEKARAYDEAYARMSKAYNDNRCSIGFMNEIFPRPKENDDESLVDEQVTTFCNITKGMCELYAKKNHDYGNSFDEGCDKIGVYYPLGRLLDKINRLIACMGKEDEMRVNESIEDTLTDLGCYSIMTLSYLRRKKKNGNS